MVAAASTGPKESPTAGRNRVAAHCLHLNGSSSAGSPLLNEVADRLPDVLLDAGLQLATIQGLWCIRTLALCKGLEPPEHRSCMHIEEYAITPNQDAQQNMTSKHSAISRSSLSRAVLIMRHG